MKNNVSSSDDDPLGPARGCTFGLLISITCLMLIILINIALTMKM